MSINESSETLNRPCIDVHFGCYL